jgi:hypothetical protein
VLAGDVGAHQLEIGGRTAADEEDRAVEPHDSAALAVSNLQTSVGHSYLVDSVIDALA